MSQKRSFSRRELVKSVAAVPFLGLGSLANKALGENSTQKLPNVVLFLTDQERATQHFPPNWEADNLPGLTWLKNHGLTFNNNYTNACMCSPARSTFMSGYLPAQHGVKYTLEANMPARIYPQVELSEDLANIATVMSAAGFNVVYKGKWHCSKPRGKHWATGDLERFGFARWNAPDAGENMDFSQAGGGAANNDGRFMYDDGIWRDGEEGVLAYLTNHAAVQQPFFLIVSLVNPHDVLFYPKTYKEAGYDDSWLKGDIEVPATVNENLLTKPSVQKQFYLMSQLGMGALRTPQMKRNYLNFYGNLMKSSDNYLVQILDALYDKDLLNDTLIIRTADHGEMGLAHGGQRQKNFNFYQESVRIPLIYSNPVFYDGAYETDALVSHVDFLPTIANLFNAPNEARANWQGVDYSRLILSPSTASVQDYVIFTYDDFQSGQPNGPYPVPPNHIVGIIEARYKLAEYYIAIAEQRVTKPGQVRRDTSVLRGILDVASQWEMYDLLLDPLETTNIAHPSYKMTKTQKTEYDRLRLKLRWVKQNRLQPLS